MTDQPSSPAARSRIVVGTDGSPQAQLAVSWALREAELRDADLEVVSAWEYPYQWAEGFNEKWEEDGASFAADAEKVASESVDIALDGRLRPVWVRTGSVRGPAAPSLLELAKDAALLVVGSRGRGGFAELLLGSVSTACVHHARCPVTVVPMPS